MKLHETEIAVPSPGGDIRTKVIRPVGDGRWPGLLLYTDIFQLTESTLRTARRLASYGFVVAVPEIYPHGELAGVALEFDDAGKADSDMVNRLTAAFYNEGNSLSTVVADTRAAYTTARTNLLSGTVCTRRLAVDS